MVTLIDANLLSDGETMPDIIELGDGIVVSYGLEDKYGKRTGRTKTKFYREAYTVRVDGEVAFKYLQRSIDGCGYSELTAYNYILYRRGWTNTVTRFLRKLDAVIHTYTGQDIAIDGYCFLDKLHRIWLEADVKNYGRSGMRAHFNPTGKILTGVDIGSKQADNRMTIYNKSPEFEDKPYQKTHCEKFGLDVSREIHRCEVKMRSEALKRFKGTISDAERANFLDAQEYALKSKQAIREYSRSITTRRAADIAQARSDAKQAILALDDYFGEDANAIRRRRDAIIGEIRGKYRDERETLEAAKEDTKPEDIVYIDPVDTSINDLLNGNFDYRQLENPAVLADMHKRSANSLLKIRKGTNKRADRNTEIPVIDYKSLGALDIMLQPIVKRPNAIWGVQRKISFDIRESYTDRDLMNGQKRFAQALVDCQKVARKYGVLDWYFRTVPKWKEDKAYHDAIRKAVRSAPTRWASAGLGYWVPPPSKDKAPTTTLPQTTQPA